MDRRPDHIQLSGGWEGDVYRSWDFPPDVVESWNSLARAAGDWGVFIGYGWFEAFWRAFSQGREPFVVVLKKEGKVKAVFPCCTMTGSGNDPQKDPVSSLTNDHTCHYDFLIEPELRQDAIGCFIELWRRIAPDREITCEYMPAFGQNGISFVQGLHKARIPVHTDDGPWAPWLKMSGNWDQFWEALPRKRRDNLKRRRKRAEEKGKLQFEAIRESRRLDEMLDVLFEIESRSWKGKEGTAIQSEPEVDRFYRRLAHWAMRENRLVLFLLKLDGRPMAGGYCLSSGGTVFLLKIGRDESFDAFSPGSLLQAEIIKYLFTRPEISVYNFLGACNSWKTEWTSQTSDYGRIMAYPKSLTGWSRYVRRYGWKNFLKRFQVARTIRAWMSREERKAV